MSRYVCPRRARPSRLPRKTLRACTPREPPQRRPPNAPAELRVACARLAAKARVVPGKKNGARGGPVSSSSLGGVTSEDVWSSVEGEYLILSARPADSLCSHSRRRSGGACETHRGEDGCCRATGLLQGNSLGNAEALPGDAEASPACPSRNHSPPRGEAGHGWWTMILLLFSACSSFFGIVITSTPSSYFEVILSVSASPGRVIVRSKRP